MNRKILITSLLGSLSGGLAHADDAADMWHFSGFGTLAATHFTRSDIDFSGASGLNVPNGVGRTSRFGINPDSKLGAQLRFAPFQSLEFTVQGLARQTPRNDWTPTLEWANLKYSFNDNFALRAGRIGAPFFMTSDYRQVNYTSISLRPSSEVYNQVPITAADVVEGLLKFDLAGGNLTIQGGGGTVRSDFVPSDPARRDVDKIRIDQLRYLNLTYEIDAWTIRAGHSAGKLTWDLAAMAPVFNTLSSLGAPGQAIRSNYEIKDAKSSFTGIGASYNPGQLIVTGEYVMRRSEKSFNDADAWTFLLGYRIGAWTPFLSYGEAKTKNRVNVSGVSNPVILTALQGMADITVRDQNTTSIGVRWDFYKNLALKAQFDHIQPNSPGISGMFRNRASDYPVRASGNAFALAIDFVF